MVVSMSKGYANGKFLPWHSENKSESPKGRSVLNQDVVYYLRIEENTIHSRRVFTGCARKEEGVNIRHNRGIP